MKFKVGDKIGWGTITGTIILVNTSVHRYSVKWNGTGEDWVGRYSISELELNAGIERPANAWQGGVR